MYISSPFSSSSSSQEKNSTSIVVSGGEITRLGGNEKGRDYLGVWGFAADDIYAATMRAIGRLYKVLPAAVVASVMRPAITRRQLQDRADALIETIGSCGANLGVTSGAEALDGALEALEARGVIVTERSRVRVRDRNVLRYYARSLEHLLESPSRRTH